MRAFSRLYDFLYDMSKQLVTKKRCKSYTLQKI